MANNGIERFSRQPAAYWLIFKDECGRTEALTVDLDDLEKVLPVFSFEEEAWMFALLPAERAGWQVRQITAGELLLMLQEPATEVGFVALDPLPEPVAAGMIGLVSLSRERFADRLP